MSLDLYEKEVRERVSARGLTTMPETSAWDGFARGVGLSAMQTFAKAGRAASMALAVPAVVLDSFGDGTELQDSFFRFHDEVFGRAVDHWTPQPGEVGVAGQITGQLLATLPLVIASPSAAVAATELSVAEDLTRRDVDPSKAVAVGAAQGAGLGLGIFVPVLGRTLAQRVLLGGAGFNLFQGVTTRASSQMILGESATAADFQAFDPTALTLDVLMGLAFGGIAHISPSARAQGEQFIKRLEPWLRGIEPSKKDAILVMRQAQHVNADSVPGMPKGPEDVGAHVARTRQAIEQLAKDQRVDVSDLPEGKFDIDEARIQDMARHATELARAAEEVRHAEGLPPVPETEVVLPRVTTEASPSPVVRPDPPPFDELEFSFRQFREGDAIPVGDPVVSKTVLYPKEQGGSAGHKVVSIDGQVVAKARISASSDGLTIEKIETLNAGRRRGFASTLVDDLFAEFPGSKVFTTPRSDDGRALFNIYPQGEGLEILPRTEAPPAPRGAEPPPPRSDEGRPGGAEATEVDPAVVAARSFAEERGDVEITVGRDVDGQPMKMKVKDFLKQSDDAVKAANDDVKLFEAAAMCMLGGA